MYKNIIFILLASFYLKGLKAQDSARLNFSRVLESLVNHKEINKLPCSDVPPGIYSLSFKINKQHQPQDFQFSNDSLNSLRSFLIVNVLTSSRKVNLPSSESKYLLLFYINVSLWCDSRNDTTVIGENLNVEIIKMLSKQLDKTELSFKTLIPAPGEYIFLNTICITDSKFPSGKGLPVDNPRSVLTTEEKKKEIEEKFRRMKERKAKHN